MPIPKDPSWRSYCVTSGKSCPDHIAGAYTGYDAYVPSPFVLETVGQRFNSPFDGVVECFGYDPRHDFWMRFSSGEQHNVSERAIGRTFHSVRL